MERRRDLSKFPQGCVEVECARCGGKGVEPKWFPIPASVLSNRRCVGCAGFGTRVDWTNAVGREVS